MADLEVLSSFWPAPLRGTPKYIIRCALGAVRRAALEAAAAGECCKPPRYINTWQSLMWRQGLSSVDTVSLATLSGRPEVDSTRTLQAGLREIVKIVVRIE